jgi:hypothetical protein
MNSYPLIETALGETERQFVEFVEQHARARDLPAETIRLRITTSIGPDCYRALHSLEVRGEAKRVWRIQHTLKRTEARQSRLVQMETRFELTGPGVPDGYGRRHDIEAVVSAALVALKATARAGITRGTTVSVET